MAVEEATFFTPVCEHEGCGWRGNPTPVKEDAEESEAEHQATMHNVKLEQKDG